MPAPVALTLIGKPGCHLCDDARAVVGLVAARLGSRGIELDIEELSILDDPALARRHAEEIPVVLVAGRRHAIWRVDPEKLTRSIIAAAERPQPPPRSDTEGPR